MAFQSEFKKYTAKSTRSHPYGNAYPLVTNNYIPKPLRDTGIGRALADRFRSGAGYKKIDLLPRASQPYKVPDWCYDTYNSSVTGASNIYATTLRSETQGNKKAGRVYTTY